MHVVVTEGPHQLLLAYILILNHHSHKPVLMDSLMAPTSMLELIAKNAFSNTAGLQAYSLQL